MISRLTPLLFFLLPACQRPAEPAAGGPGKGGPPVPVLVAEAVRKDMPVSLRSIGRVSSEATVSVKPQVTGRITALHFAEGQDVQAGDVLVTIDPRPFEVALAQARADLSQATIGAKNASDQAARYTQLDRAGGASKEQLEQFVTAAKQAASQVESAEAAVQKAGLELEYCTIRAAISGRTGKHLVTPGNVVTANQTDLVVINQIAPIDVTFTLPEKHLAAVQSGMASGSLAVRAVVEGQERREAQGTLRFLDNTVKALSGTIDLKASFPNDPQLLWPGQFVSVVLDLEVQKDALVIPSHAPQAGQDGLFVFVVQADQTVAVRPVAVARTVRGEAVISEGLQPGDQVVTDGQSRLAKGARVQVKESLEAAAAEAISGKKS